MGIKSRGCYETPAGTVLREAHLDLEGITMDREVMRIRDTLSAEFSRLCYYGFWYVSHTLLIDKHPLTYALDHLYYLHTLLIYI